MKEPQHFLDGDLIVIDDFYLDAPAVRARALALNYDGPGENGHYPGIQSTDALVAAGLEKTFSQLAGVDLMPAVGAVYGKIRVGLEDQVGEVAVHIDHVDWSAIIYLNDPPAGQFSGLSVVRHRELPAARIDSKLLDELGLDDRKEFDKTWVRPYNELKHWERVETVGCRANRLVLLKSGSYCHVIEEVFGNDLETGRMTHSFFMDEAA